MHFWMAFRRICSANATLALTGHLTFCEASFPSRRLAEDCGTADTQHDSLSVTEHRGDLVAACTQTGQIIGRERHETAST